MRNSGKLILGIVMLGIVAILGGIGWQYGFQGRSSGTVIRYGVTPYQDSALPVVADRLGWYGQHDLQVRLVDLGWEDVPLALASGEIDVALYNFNSFLAPWQRLADGGKELIFYAPLYVWTGAAIMVHGEDKSLEPIGDITGFRQLSGSKK
jgi:NitT/TauT family transport system substrate-binding protein